LVGSSPHRANKKRKNKKDTERKLAPVKAEERIGFPPTQESNPKYRAKERYPKPMQIVKNTRINQIPFQINL
jgi:hypothetical protein